MTQPAFSRRIRALEEWLGVVLFDRTSHPATPTETGERFRSVAQEILARVARVRARPTRPEPWPTRAPPRCASPKLS
jgi:DNA-binding transcriptional LysR family regulator